MKIRIGSRGSDLALAQSRWVAAQLEALPQKPTVEIEIIKTRGDVNLDRPLASFAGEPDAKGLFTKELEQALLEGRIDLAIHSFKDLPTENPAGLTLACTPPREDPEDILLFRKSSRGRDHLPFVSAGSRIGTSSIRRQELVRHHWPDIKITDIRGNVPTRLARLFDSDPDRRVEALLLAAAGMKRLRAAGAFADALWSDRLAELEVHPLEAAVFPPAPAQGALALQCRADDGVLIECLMGLHSDPDFARVQSERHVLRVLEGGCHVPLGCHCVPSVRESFSIHVFHARSGKVRRLFTRHAHTAEALGKAVGQELLGQLPIIVTGKSERVAEIRALAPERVIACATIETEALPIPAEDLKNLSDLLETNPILAAFSATGVRAFFELARQNVSIHESLSRVRWAVVGSRTEAALLDQLPRAPVAFRSPDGTAGGLAAVIQSQPDDPKVIALAAERTRPDFYTKLGPAIRLKLNLYRTKPIESLDKANLPPAALVILGSPSSVDGFQAHCQAAGRSLSEPQLLLCAIGPTTADYLRSLDLEPYAIAPEPDYEAFVRELSHKD